MSTQWIRIQGARTHNLKSVNVDIPRERLVVVTGVSGSGKSSLAFDTIYAEGQRRYVESLSAYARQFLSVMEKPDADLIEGLSPAISIEQKATSHNPRSTVGTITEIHDHLRLLYARAGTPRCPTHGVPLDARTVSQMVDGILAQPPGGRWMLLAPVVDGRRGEHAQVLETLRAQGFVRARIDGEVVDLDQPPPLEGRREHTVEAVVDRFRIREDLAGRLADSIETALGLSGGIIRVVSMDADESGEPLAPPLVYSSRFACPQCDFSLTELEPRMFSFNNPHGACPQCDGLGVERYFCPERIVSRPGLSPAEGAIRGWDRRNLYYYEMLRGLAAHYDFDLATPWTELPEAIQHVLLFGSDGEEITFHYPGRNGSIERTHPFEGVVHNLERRYREADSTTVREELARYIDERPCPACGGTRLNEAARHVEVGGEMLPTVIDWTIRQAAAFYETLQLPGARGQISERILHEIRQRLHFLIDVGLDYLTLGRPADTLSGGEAQRIRLASQIGAGLVGVMYVLDEPSIGLHPRDNSRLLSTLERLRDQGNTVIVVEHDEDAIRTADHVIDMGPRAGEHGGEVVATGTAEEIARVEASVTGAFLSGRRAIPVPPRRRRLDPQRCIHIHGARGHNLKSIDVRLPLGGLIGITGVSGSGKSTLINDTLYRQAAHLLNGAHAVQVACDGIDGLDHFDKVVDIDQSPIGRTPRSNPATYTGVFGPIRELFAGTPEARARGYKSGRFSFNVKGGRCEACQGDGVTRVEMHFLPDLFVSCDVCDGQRYNRETLEIRYRGHTIHDVLEMTVDTALAFFDAVPQIRRKLETLQEVGLGYVRLGQSATTLSGGEAQRIKLARELSRREHGRSLYILDEPTTGLHFHDVEQLLSVLQRLVDHGNTVVVIEHHLEIIKSADWLIDLGPEGGDGGGELVAAGTPEDVADVEASHTGRFLRGVLTAAATTRAG